MVHARPPDLISVRPLAAESAQKKAHGLLKTGPVQQMRLELTTGQTVPTHHVGSETALPCLGRVLVPAPGRQCRLAEGELMLLPAHEPHALEAQADSSLPGTLLLPQDEPAGASGTLFLIALSAHQARDGA